MCPGFEPVHKTADRIYYKGYGTEPFVYCAIKGSENRFDGAAFVVDTLSDLELAAKTLPNATPIHPLSDDENEVPGGGKRVTFYDPVDKYPFHLVYGQTPAPAGNPLPELSYNYPHQKNRSVNKSQRFKHGPAPVHKMGHFGTCVTDFEKSYKFYTDRFNFKATELVYDERGRDVTTFLHLDRKNEDVDHHVFFFFEGEFACNRCCSASAVTIIPRATCG